MGSERRIHFRGPGAQLLVGANPPPLSKAEHLYNYLTVSFACNFAHKRSECGKASRPVIRIDAGGDASPLIPLIPPLKTSGRAYGPMGSFDLAYDVTHPTFMARLTTWTLTNNCQPWCPAVVQCIRKSKQNNIDALYAIEKKNVQASYHHIFI